MPIGPDDRNEGVAAMPQGASGMLNRFTDRAKLVVRELKTDMQRDDVPGLGAEIAYHAIFAIPPLIILVVTIAAAVNQFTGYELANRLIDTINENAPGNTRELLINLVENAIANVSGGLASVGVLTAALIAVWSGSNGLAAMMKAFNRAYGVVDGRSWLRRKTVAIGMTLVVTLLINAAFLLLVFGEDLAEWGVRRLDLGRSAELAIDLLRWPISVIFIMVVLALLYYVGPAVDQSFRWISPGSAIATLCWLALVFGFKIYLQYSDPGSAYGALGSIVVLLFFLYLSAIIFVIGAEINAILGTRYDPVTVRDLAQNPEKVTDTLDRPAIRASADETQVGPEPKDRPAPAPPRRRGRRPEASAGEGSARAGRAIGYALFAGFAIAGLLRRRSGPG